MFHQNLMSRPISRCSQKLRLSPESSEQAILAKELEQKTLYYRGNTGMLIRLVFFAVAEIFGRSNFHLARQYSELDQLHTSATIE